MLNVLKLIAKPVINKSEDLLSLVRGSSTKKEIQLQEEIDSLNTKVINSTKKEKDLSIQIVGLTDQLVKLQQSETASDDQSYSLQLDALKKYVALKYGMDTEEKDWFKKFQKVVQELDGKAELFEEFAKMAIGAEYKMLVDEEVSDKVKAFLKLHKSSIIRLSGLKPRNFFRWID